MFGLINFYSLTTIPYSFLCFLDLKLICFDLFLIINVLSHIIQDHNRISVHHSINLLVRFSLKHKFFSIKTFQFDTTKMQYYSL